VAAKWFTDVRLFFVEAVSVASVAGSVGIRKLAMLPLDIKRLWYARQAGWLKIFLSWDGSQG